MKNILITFAALFSIYCSAYAGSKNDDNVISKEVHLKSFEKIKVNTCVLLKYAQNSENKQRIVISGSEKNLKELTLKVRNNTLYIDADFNVSSIFSNQEEVKVNITSPILNGVEINSSADVYILTPLKDEKNIDFVINGSGNMETKSLLSDKISININGSGDIETGDINCRNFKFVNNASGDLEIETVKAKENCLIYTNGSGDAEIEEIFCNQLIYKNNSSADVEIDNLRCNHYIIKTQGSGETAIKGKGINGEVSSSGSGDINLKHLETKSINVSSNGSGNINYNADETTSLREAGSGDIKNFK